MATAEDTTNNAIKNVIALIDLENIDRTMREEIPPFEGFSYEAGFERIKEWLNSIVNKGGTVWIIIYVTEGKIIVQNVDKLFDSFGFTVVFCRSEKGPTGELKDTTDKHLLRDGLALSKILDSSSCICIGSGDCDFLPIAYEARKKEINIAIIGGSNRSINPMMKKAANIHPKTKDKMIHIFTPLKV